MAQRSFLVGLRPHIRVPMPLSIPTSSASRLSIEMASLLLKCTRTAEAESSSPELELDSLRDSLPGIPEPDEENIEGDPSHRLRAMLINPCGDDGNTEKGKVSSSPNLLMCAVLGMERVEDVPLHLSVRHESHEMLVVDNHKQISPLHFSAVPTTSFIPDWRYLLRRPREGLTLQHNLINAAEAVAEDHFLTHSPWSNFFLRQPATFTKKDFFASFHFPPSQHQLHVHYICPVLMPHEKYLFDKGLGHFQAMRYFPAAYTEQCLRAAVDRPLPPELLQESTPIECVIGHFRDKHGIDYEVFRRLDVQRLEEAHALHSNWQKDHFFGEAREIPSVASGSQLLFFPHGAETPDETVDVVALAKADKTLLQSRGRPFNGEQNPTGSLYSFPKTWGEVDWW